MLAKADIIILGLQNAVELLSVSVAYLTPVFHSAQDHFLPTIIDPVEDAHVPNSHQIPAFLIR